MKGRENFFQNIIGNEELPTIVATRQADNFYIFSYKRRTTLNCSENVGRSKQLPIVAVIKTVNR